MTLHDSRKRAVRYMMERGLATQNELTQLSGYSRQLIFHWGKEFPEARREYLKQQWNKALRFASKKL